MREQWVYILSKPDPRFRSDYHLQIRTMNWITGLHLLNIYEPHIESWEIGQLLGGN